MIFLYVLFAIVMFGLGVFVGCFLSETDGLLIVDNSEVEKANWILDVKTDPADIPKKKSIKLKVVQNNSKGVM